MNYNPRSRGHPFWDYFTEVDESIAIIQRRAHSKNPPTGVYAHTLFILPFPLARPHRKAEQDSEISRLVVLVKDVDRASRHLGSATRGFTDYFGSVGRVTPSVPGYTEEMRWRFVSKTATNRITYAYRDLDELMDAIHLELIKPR